MGAKHEHTTPPTLSPRARSTPQRKHKRTRTHEHAEVQAKVPRHKDFGGLLSDDAPPTASGGSINMNETKRPMEG